MNAGFFRRITSSLIDMALIFTVIYFSFTLFGRTILQSNVENYQEINTAYNDIMQVYNQNMQELQLEYDVKKELAGDNEELKDEALEEYLSKTGLLNQQNLIDIEPYNRPLGIYFTSVVYYYIFLFLVLMSIFTLVTKGKTLGRRTMGLKLVGPTNPLNILFHDIGLKYLLIIALVPINVLFAVMALMFMFIIDMALIAASRNKNTIRDIITKITVERIGYKY
jgi:hypothetical protein